MNDKFRQFLRSRQNFRTYMRDNVKKSLSKITKKRFQQQGNVLNLQKVPHNQQKKTKYLAVIAP